MLQCGPHVWGNVAEVLCDQAMGADLLQQRPEEPFPMLAVVFTIFIGCIVPVDEARQLAVRDFHDLLGRKICKSRVLGGWPREAIDPEESERMIHAEQVKDTHEELEAPSPPGVIVLGHAFPVVERETPVLTPFFGERVSPEGLFRRRPAGMLQVEDVRFPPHVRAVPADADGDISHERNSLVLGVHTNRQPLCVGRPLHIGMEAHEIAHVPLADGSKRFCPDPHCGGRTVLPRPLIAVFTFLVPAHECSMNRVIGQPVGIGSFEVRERLRSRFVGGTRAKSLESGVEELPLQFLDLPVVHETLTKH